MKFSVDNQEILSIKEWEKSLIQNDIPSEIFESDMQRRARYALEMPVFKIIELRKEKIIPILIENGVTRVPGKMEELAEFLGKRTDLNLKLTSFSSGCSLECDRKSFFHLSPSYLNIIKTYINEDETKFIDEQLQWVFQEKIRGCIRRMRAFWEPIFNERGLDIPIKNEEFVTMVISQKDYKNRSMRDKEHNAGLLV